MIRLKSYAEIVTTAAKLFNMYELDVELELHKRLRALKIPKMTVVLYVNWASHNVLTYNELAEGTGLSIANIKVQLQRLKRKFPHLFMGAAPAMF